jgi:tRNA 2-selenouridine synthase
MNQIAADQFESLFLEARPFLDVRAPIEFASGSIPGAVSRPLLSNEERHQIGLTYKLHGPEAAVELGHQMISGSVKEQRIANWMKAINERPGTVIYCFRGGLRSQIVQAWLKENGISIQIVHGGYKALRRFLKNQIEERVQNLEFKVLSGPTGSGKTKFLYKSGEPFLDLEALAKHRGSAFGAMTEPQPAQIDFENALAVALMKLGAVKRPVLIESESRLIGKLVLPETLFKKIHVSPRMTLAVPFSERVDGIFEEYVKCSKLGLNGDISWFEDIRASVHSISKRLGGARTSEILNDVAQALADFENSGTLETNRIWIAKLLEWYYDPLYAKWNA